MLPAARVRVEPRSFDQGHREDDAFIHSSFIYPLKNQFLLIALRLTIA